MTIYGSGFRQAIHDLSTEGLLLCEPQSFAVNNRSNLSHWLQLVEPCGLTK